MKSIVKVGAFLLLLTTFACASSKSHATPEELAALDKMLSNKQFKIEAKWAQPMASQGLNSIANAGLLPPGSTASRIDVSGSSGYLRMVGDSVKANLPFLENAKWEGIMIKTKRE